MLSSEVWCSRVSCASPWESPDSIAARVLLGNPDAVAPDSNACSVSSREGVPTPCTRRQSPLRRADISLPEFCPIRHVRILWEDISHPAPDTGWERRRFKFPCQTYPDLLIALTRRASTADISAYPKSIRGRHFSLSGEHPRSTFQITRILHSAAVFSWSFPLCATDILSYFALDIWCLNPQTLLVIHLS